MRVQRARRHHPAAREDHRVEDRAVKAHRQPVNQRTREERTGERDRADQHRDHDHLRADSPNTETLVTPITSEITASVAITAAPSSPRAISSESRMMPPEVVPPTITPQPAAEAASPRSESERPRRLNNRRSGTLAIIMPPISSATPRPLR